MSKLNVKKSERRSLIALFQVMAAVHAIQKHLQVSHRDIKAENVLYKRIKPGGYFCYIVHGRRYYVPNRGIMILLSDFGAAECYDPNLNDICLRSRGLLNAGVRPFVIDQKQAQMYPIVLESRETSDVVNFGQIGEEGAVLLPGKVDIEAGPKGEKILGKMNPSEPQFYKNSDVLPFWKAYIDTQDTIGMFAGGQRMEVDDIHYPRSGIAHPKVKAALKPYVVKKSDIAGDKIKAKIWENLRPEQLLAGYFIDKFFGENKIFTDKVSPNSIIETYTIS